jgi:hypothetical protein
MNFNQTLNAIVLTGLTFTASVAIAATPTAFMGSATINTTENRIEATYVPVQDASGKVVYKNVLLDFQVDDAGNLSLAVGSPTITPAPILPTTKFKAGQYKDANGKKYTVAGPSVIPGTARTSWSLVSNAIPQISLNWITGNVIGHPNQTILNLKKITSNGFSWGTVGFNSSSSGTPFYNWQNGSVVGAVQSVNQITFHLFQNNDNIEDASVSLQYCNTVC